VQEVEVNAEIFGLSPRQDILHRVVRWQLARARSGTRKTKSLTEVSGTGKKPFKQKGTGNARAGTLRSVHHRGGAIAHGPVVRSHEHQLTKKFRKLALRHALSAKMLNEEIFLIESLSAPSSKTKDLAKIVKSYEANRLLVIYDGLLDSNVAMSGSNLRGFDVLNQMGANVYDLLKHDKILITKEAMSKIEERLL
jgi:large subunit ribosomal protein L4